MLCFNVALLYFFVLFKPAAAVEITNTNFEGIQTGSPFTITWTGNAGPVTILLRMGNNTDPSKDIAKAIWVDLPGTSFVWVPGPILQTGQYVLQLADSAVQPVYSPGFQLRNVPVTTTLSSASPSAAATSSSSQGSASKSISQSRASDPTPTSSSPLSSTTDPASATTSDTSSSTASSQAQTSGPPGPRVKVAVKIGVAACLIFILVLAIFLTISLIRHRCARKNRLSSLPPPSSSDGVLPKNNDLEHGQGVQMSGALDSAISISNGVSSPTTDISSRRPSTRPSTGPTIEEEVEMVEVQQEPVEIGSSGYGKETSPKEKEQAIEIGSSGYGKQMSGQEKEKAFEVEAHQHIPFEERKQRRRRVRLLLGRRRIWF